VIRYLRGLDNYWEVASGRSAQPRLPDDPGNLLTDQPLDDTREMFVEPRLQHRTQHFTNEVFQSTLGTTIARYGAELSKGGCGRSGGSGRDDAFPNRAERWLAYRISLWLGVCSRDRPARIGAC